jgi:hypothetical protein
VRDLLVGDFFVVHLQDAGAPFCRYRGRYT